MVKAILGQPEAVSDLGLFKSSKTMSERAQDERDKLAMKQIRVQQERADIDLIRARKGRADELRRLTA